MFKSFCCFFFFKLNTAYEMRISDLSSDVCSSDLRLSVRRPPRRRAAGRETVGGTGRGTRRGRADPGRCHRRARPVARRRPPVVGHAARHGRDDRAAEEAAAAALDAERSEEHTSELQSLMRISYAVFCLKKKTN